jgi:hypothetical protein
MPAILLDVDGPLNPFNAKTTKPLKGYTSHRMKPKGFEYGKGLLVRLCPLHGPSLATSGAELIWATTWSFEANDWIGPHIGLPELPVIDWSKLDAHHVPGLYWKTPLVAQWMNENRPGVKFLWLDDEPGKRDIAWLSENTDGNGFIRIISPYLGLKDNDFTEINQFVEENS